MNKRTPIQVLVYPFKQSESKIEFLLLKRTKERGGFWQGVTGHTERSEKIIDGAKRELLEETSFIPKFIFQTEYSYSIKINEEMKDQFPPETTELLEHVFLARIDQEDDPTIDSLEHVDWKWCSYREALELLKWEENKKALEYCNDLLRE
ncbi:MAG: NUDIX hydrolase [Candidatus Heimdallarchaeaceae archaeon]